MNIFELIQLIVLAPSLIFVGLQVLFQRRQTINQVLVQGQELYHLLSTQYISLTRESDAIPLFNDVWVKLDPDRKAELDAAQAGSLWGAWFAMTREEKQCYRYVRATVETFEQMFQLHRKGWIDEDTWNKWHGWISLCPQMKYFKYVLEDSQDRLIPSFVAELMRSMAPDVLEETSI